MSTNFQLTDGTDTINIDESFLEMTLGGHSRKYNQTEYAGRNGGIIRGFGTYTPHEISISKKDRLTATGETFWNSTRSTFVKWFTKPKRLTLHFIVTDSTTSVQYRTEVRPFSMGADIVNQHIGINENRAFSFRSVSGIYETTTVTTTNYTYTAADATENFTATVSQTVETPPVIKFTPTNNATYLDIKIADNFGVRLQSSPFIAGSQIVYDTADNSLTIGGTEESTRQFLTSGSGFFLEPGDNTVYVTSDSIGAVVITHKERVI